MRLIHLVPTASFAVAVAASVYPFTPPLHRLAAQPLQQLGMACPAGMISEAAAQAHEAREEGREANEEAEGSRFVCVPKTRPESFAEFQRLDQARGESQGPSVPGALRKAVQDKAAMAVLQAAVPNAEGVWTEYGTGPQIGNDARFPEVNGQGFTNLSGRVDQFAYDPTHKRLFAAVGNGGVWMSEAVNGDVKTLSDSWVSLGDSLPFLVVSGVGWSSEGGPDGTVIALTGEHSQGGNTYVGLGAYWSTDLGKTWNHASGIPDEALAFHVEVDPTNPKIVYAATGKGLFRSTDAGHSYTNVALPVSTDCAGVDGLNKKLGTTPDGMGPCLLANFVTDVIVKAPGGSTSEKGGEVIAAVGYRAGALAYNDGKPSSPGNGLYKSPTGEPGTFKKLSVAGNGNTSAGFAQAERTGRIALGKAFGDAQNHNFVYALVEDTVLFNGGLIPIAGLPIDTIVGPVATAVDCSSLPGGPGGDPQFVCNTVKGGATLGATTVNGVYVSSDFGDSWTRLASTTDIAVLPDTGSSLIAPSALGVGPGIQSWYNEWIAVDPTQTSTLPSAGVPTRVGFGLEEVWQNRAYAGALRLPQDGTGADATQGSAYAVIGPYFSGTRCQLLIGSVGLFGITPSLPVCPTDTNPIDTGTRKTTHPDQHAGLYIPTGDGGVCLFAGNDGGVFRQCAASGVEMDNTKWEDANNAGFHTLYHYGFAAAKDGTVWFGNQDNGSGKIQHATKTDPTTPLNTYQTYVGDGVFALVDPDNSDIAYVETPGLSLQLTTDGGTSYTSITPTNVTNAYFASLILMDETDKKHLLVGGNEIFESTLGEATTSDTWTQVFTLGTGPGGAGRNMRAAATRDKISYVAYCGPCSVYGSAAATGFDRGIATNAGAADADKAKTNGWHFATAKGLPNRYINWLYIDPDDATGKTVYVGLGGYTLARWLPAGMYLDPKTADAQIGAGNVWKSVDGGENFANISGNLPDARVTTLYKHRGQLYVGTEIGAFVGNSPATGTAPVTFAPFGSGLPNVVVTQFQAQPGNPDRVFASTFGRGMWAINTTAPLPIGGGTTGGGTTGGSTGGATTGGSTGGGSTGGGKGGGAAGGLLLPLLGLFALRRRRRG